MVFFTTAVIALCISYFLFVLHKNVANKIKNAELKNAELKNAELKSEIQNQLDKQMGKMMSAMETVLIEPVKRLEYKLIIQDRRQAYIMQTLKASITENKDDLKICVQRHPETLHHHMGCFTKTFCIQSLPFDTEEININVDSCLQPFFNLKRIKQSGIKDALPEALENLFVKELHLVSSQDLDLQGIEKMPSLRTLTFENCKNIFLDRLFTTTHNIDTIYTINTPCLLQYKSRLLEIDIELI